MADFGLTTSGFTAKTLEILVAEVEDDFKAEFGFLPRGFLKKLIPIVCERFTELWELGELCFSSLDPDAVTDSLQDALNSLTGTQRNPATPSSATLTCCGTPTTLIPSDSQAKVPLTGDTFQTKEDATIIALDAWLATTSYSVDDRVTNAGHCYVCTDGGTSAGSGGPTGTDPDVAITDSGVEWRFIGEGTGAVDVIAENIVNGPVIAEARTITQIVTATSGWDSVTNLTDADVGTDVETNEDYRVRREQELSQAGATTPDAIRAQLLEVDGVTSVTVFYNPNDTTDGDGLPPHAVECLIRGGNDQAIFDSLLESCIAAGINTFGTEEGTSEDEEGNEHTIKFSRPEEIEIYVILDVLKDVKTFPADGSNQVKSAIVAFGDAQKSGKNAVASSIGAQAFTVDGVLDATDVKIGIAPTPTLSTTIAISTRQLAVFDTSRITVNVSDGTP